MKLISCLLGVSCLLTACTAAPPERAGPVATATQATQAGQSSDIQAGLDAEVAGEPRDCIDTRQILQTDIVNNRTIVFRMRSGPDYRNDLPAACPLLDDRRGITYRVYTGRLCRIDTVNVVDFTVGVDYGACGLGSFTPIKAAKQAAGASSG